MKEAEVGPPNKELYALLHISPEASDEEIRKAYRQWAQVYHPDKYQSPQMKDIATENFQRICEAYEILSDERKRQIYDIYGMEGLTSGLELGPKLNKAEEIKEELERLRRRKEMEKVSAHVQPSGSILANLSLPQFLKGGSIMRGMAMSSELQSQISKRNAIAIGGNLAVNGNAGGGAASVMLRHQISSVSSIEFMASTGLRALIGVQTSRNLSLHSTATMGITMSLRDGSINLSNSWTRQLSDTSSGNIQLVLGPESSVAVGWQKKEEKMSAAGEIKPRSCTEESVNWHFIGLMFGHPCGHVDHNQAGLAQVLLELRLIILTASPQSLMGVLLAELEDTMLELEVGGGRKISQFSTVRMLYSVGIQSCKSEIEKRIAAMQRVGKTVDALGTAIVESFAAVDGGGVRRVTRRRSFGSMRVSVEEGSDLPRLHEVVGLRHRLQQRRRGIQVSQILNSAEAEAPIPGPSQLNLTVLMAKQGSKSFADLLKSSGAESIFNDNLDAVGIFWKFELHRGRQKLIVPHLLGGGLLFMILLSRHLNAVFATGAFVIPTSLYFFLKTFIIKPYYLKREKQKMLENMEKTSTQVQEARAAAEKAQQLLQNVANRKRSRQLETDGLVITKAVYGSKKSLNKKRDEAEEANDELASQVIDVTLPLNFLANDSGQLKLHEGVKKSGIMGFCDPCPGEPKQLRVEYTYHGDRYEVVVDDYEELLIPQAAHKI
ncbi:unnamed protein product [Camellia sinensis]